MLYVVNQENHLKYYPFIDDDREDDGGEREENLTALVGSAFFRVPVDNHKLDLFLKVHSKDDKFVRYDAEYVTYEFQEVLWKTALENRRMAAQDKRVFQEIEFLRTFVQYGELLWGMKDYRDDPALEKYGSTVEERAEYGLTQIRTALEKLNSRASFWLCGGLLVPAGNEYQLVKRRASTSKEFYTVEGRNLMEDSSYRQEVEWRSCQITRVLFGRSTGIDGVDERELAAVLEGDGLESGYEENPDNQTPAANFGFELEFSDDGKEYISLKKVLNSELDTVKIPAYYKKRPVISVEGGAFRAKDMEHVVVHGAAYGKNSICVRHVRLPETIEFLKPEAFAGATSLRDIQFSGKEKEIPQRCFYGCETLRKLELADTVEKIGRRAFEKCSSLRNLAIPSGVKIIEKGAFKDCRSIRKFYLPDSVRLLGKAIFSGCESLEMVSLPAGITEIPEEMFCGCTSLKRIELPEGITQIGRKAFEGCSSLEEVLLPKTLKEIGEAAFRGADCLKRLVLPDGIEEIEYGVFEDGIALVTKTYLEMIEQYVEQMNADCQQKRESRYEMPDGTRHHPMTAEEQAEQARQEAERQLLAEIEARRARLRELASVKLSQGMQNICRVSAKKKVYVRRKDDMEEVLKAVKKAYSGTQEETIFSQTKKLLEEDADLKYQQFVLSCVADIEETDDVELLTEIDETERMAGTDDTERQAEMIDETIPYFTKLADGGNAVFCYAAGCFSMLPQELAGEKMIPVMLLNDTLLCVGTTAVYNVHLLDGSAKTKEVPEESAECMQKSLESNISPEQQFILRDETLKQLLHENIQVIEGIET